MKKFQLFLENRLKSTLPGENAQNIMRPNPASGAHNHMTYTPESGNFRNSSVLIPIIAWKGKLEVVLTLRTAGIKHGGQISFPGGGREGDETFEETALREAHEEIGLEADHVHIAGILTNLYVNHSRHMVTPVIGFIEQEQEFIPNPNEVSEIFTVPFSELIEKKNHIREEWKLRETNYTVPFWDVHNVPLWGATAMMMSELVELYKEFLADTE